MRLQANCGLVDTTEVSRSARETGLVSEFGLLQLGSIITDAVTGCSNMLQWLETSLGSFDFRSGGHHPSWDFRGRRSRR
jgi:hypothetical protein